MNQKNQSSENCQRNLEKKCSPKPSPIRPGVLPPPAPAPTNSPKNPARAPEMRYTGLYNRHSRPRPCRNSALYDPRKPSAHPTYLPPTMPSAPPPSLPSLATSVHGPLFHQSPFSVRLRSSKNVSDRPSAPPAIPAESPKCSPDSASQAGKRARHFASLRVTSRHCAPLRGKIRPQTPVKKVSPPHLGIADTSNDWSKNVGIYSMTAFSLNFGSPDSWRANRRASRSSDLCPSQESDVP